ncbi:hypothetical protein K0U83_23430 [bacterium]|nr:hypothetical protein [bacterium]
MNNFNQWAARHPQAAAELQAALGAVPWPANDLTDGKSEAWAQQQVRLNWAKHSVVGRDGARVHGMAWRNNVGATPARCKHCGEKQQPVRYGLANDSQRLNEAVKSHDVIGIIPRLIRPQDVGAIVGQFGSIETKRPGWKYTGKNQEQGQANWGALIRKLGGFATFSTGEIEL